MRIMVFDPAGNWSKNEGSGTTGWAYFDNRDLLAFGDIAANEFDSLESYFYEHYKLMEVYRPDTIVCESYKLQHGKALQQLGSSLETPQLIGYIRMKTWEEKWNWVFQDPKNKIRVSDEILVHMGVFEKKGNRYYCDGRATNDHMRDAIRHGVFFHKYNKELKKLVGDS